MEFWNDVKVDALACSLKDDSPEEKDEEEEEGEGCCEVHHLKKQNTLVIHL